MVEGWIVKRVVCKRCGVEHDCAGLMSVGEVLRKATAGRIRKREERAQRLREREKRLGVIREGQLPLWGREKLEKRKPGRKARLTETAPTRAEVAAAHVEMPSAETMAQLAADVWPPVRQFAINELVRQGVVQRPVRPTDDSGDAGSIPAPAPILEFEGGDAHQISNGESGDNAAAASEPIAEAAAQPGISLPAATAKHMPNCPCGLCRLSRG